MTLADTCAFMVAWRGRCPKPAIAGAAMCEEHQVKTCGECGRPATHDCARTQGALICGALLCSDPGCRDQHGHQHD
jgi:hypothetical protein